MSIIKLTVKSFLIEIEPKLLIVSDGPTTGRTQFTIEIASLFKDIFNFD